MPTYDRVPQLVSVVYYKETTRNTSPAVATGHVAPVSETFSFERTEEAGKTKRRANTLAAPKPPRGFWKAQGQVGFTAEPDWIGLIMTSILGAATVTGTINFTHTWKQTDTVVPYTHTIEVVDKSAVGAGGPQSIDILNGVALTGFEINATKEASELEFIVEHTGTGKGSHGGTTPIDATPATYPGASIPLTTFAVKIDGVLSVCALEAKLSAKRRNEVPNLANGLEYNEKVVQSGWDITIDLTGLWTVGDDDIRVLATGRATHAIEVSFTLPDTVDKVLTIKLPQVDFALTNGPGLGGKDDVTRKITGTGTSFYTTNTDNTQMVVTLAGPTTADYVALWTA